MKLLKERLAYALSLNPGMSQYDLARLAGISQPTVNRLLNGASEKSRSIVDLANALNVDPEWLATGKGVPQKGTAAPLDESRLIPLWNESGATGDYISWMSEIKPSWRAYITTSATGFTEVPKGALVVVDTEAPAGHDDFVLVSRGERLYVFRYIAGGKEDLLQPGDSRLSPIQIEEPNVLIGTIVFVLRDLRT